MVVALQVQQSVHSQVSKVRFQRLALLHGLPRDHGGAEHEIAVNRAPRRVVGKCEHVCRVVPAAVTVVEAPGLGRPDNPYRDLAAFPERGASPMTKAFPRRNSDPSGRNLKTQGKPCAAAAA